MPGRALAAVKVLIIRSKQFVYLLRIIIKTLSCCSYAECKSAHLIIAIFVSSETK